VILLLYLIVPTRLFFNGPAEKQTPATSRHSALSDEERQHAKKVIESWIKNQEVDAGSTNQTLDTPGWLEAVERQTSQIEKVASDIEKIAPDVGGQGSRSREQLDKLLLLATNVEEMLQRLQPDIPPGLQADRCRDLIQRVRNVKEKVKQ